MKQTIFFKLLGKMAKISTISHIFSFKNGWISTVRSSLGMTQAQLGKKIGVTQPNVNRLETSEKNGTITLRSLEKAANAMGCRLVYGFVPNSDLKNTVNERAWRTAETLVQNTITNMQLEDEQVSKSDQNLMIKEIRDKLIGKMDSSLWD